MIACIIGHSGAGKSTIFNCIKKYYDRYYEADRLVQCAYDDDFNVKYYIQTNFSVVDEKGTVNKVTLLEKLLADKDAKEKFEDFLFETVLIPIINEAEAEGNSLLIDGILPYEKYLNYFDQVITVKVNEETRRNNLLSRGVSAKRIDQIFKLQEGLF